MYVCVCVCGRGALQVVLATLLGGSVLFGLYSLLVFLVTSFGQVLHCVGSDSDTHSDLPGLEGSQSQGHGGGGRGGRGGRGRERGRHIQLDVNEVHYPVSYWTEKGGRPYQVTHTSSYVYVLYVYIVDATVRYSVLQCAKVCCSVLQCANCANCGGVNNAGGPTGYSAR
jgi:hypothetical protein